MIISNSSLCECTKIKAKQVFKNCEYYGKYESKFTVFFDK